MKNTKFVVKVVRGTRVAEYVQRIDRSPVQTTLKRNLALVMGKFTAEWGRRNCELRSPPSWLQTTTEMRFISRFHPEHPLRLADTFLVLTDMLLL